MAIHVFNPTVVGATEIKYITVEKPVYVGQTPVEITLYADSWNGTTYTLIILGYTIASTPQIGLPEISDYANTEAVVKAALTIPQASGTSIVISAVNAPTTDLKITIFGLEASA